MLLTKIDIGSRMGKFLMMNEKLFRQQIGPTNWAYFSTLFFITPFFQNRSGTSFISREQFLTVHNIHRRRRRGLGCCRFLLCSEKIPRVL